MIPKHDFLVSPKKIYNTFKQLLDEYRENIETKDIFYYKYLLNEIERTNFWNISCSSSKICMHVYKNGKKAGHICGAKVFIKTNNKLQKYLCSRHCRDYITKGRNYTKYNKRCSFIRNNGNICKHKCEKDKNYCYIHKEEEKNIHIESLEIAHPKFNDSNMYKDLIFKKINKNMKFSKVPNFSKFFKIFNLYNRNNSYKYYNKIKYKL